MVGNQLAQVVPSGKLLLIGLESGELETTVNLGRPLARSPVNDESGQHLYILGRQDCLFVLAREPLSCVGSYTWAIMDGSIPCAPARLGRFLIVPENDSLYNSRLHILILDEDGVKVRPVQDVGGRRLDMADAGKSGPIVWGPGTRGDTKPSPWATIRARRRFARWPGSRPIRSSTGPAFALARSDRELWVASGHAGRYRARPRAGRDRAPDAARRSRVRRWLRFRTRVSWLS